MFNSKTVALVLLAAAPVFGAFNAGSIWRVSTLGSDANGGAFDPSVASPGTDESTGAGTAMTITLASSTTGSCSPVCSATTHGPGNFFFPASGAGCTTTHPYEIKTQAAGVVTFDSAMGTTGNVCVGVLGGPFLTIGQSLAFAIASNAICAKADGTYSISANLSVALSGLMLKGYTTTCGVNGVFGDSGPATIQTSAAITGMISVSAGNGVVVSNFVLDCNSQAGTVRAINATGGISYYNNVLAKNCATAGIAASVTIQLSNVRVTGSLSGCTAGITTSASLSANIVISDTNACHGLSSSSTLFCAVCIMANNTGTSDGFNLTGSNAVPVYITQSMGYANGRDGINFTSSGVNSAQVQSSVFYGNTTKDIASTSVAVPGGFNYNAYRSGSITNVTAGSSDVILTVDPTVNGGALNFAPNATAGGGAALVVAGFPGVLTTGGTGYLDIGPLQAQSTGAASSGIVGQGIIQ